MDVTPAELARMLLEVGARGGPLHSQLGQGIRELIDLGELPPGARLPSERSLAVALSVSRTTVGAAYQALAQEDRLERRQGSGTRVRAPASAAGRHEPVRAHALAGGNASAHFLNGPLATIDFATAALPPLPLVPEVCASVTRGEYERLTTEYHGYHPRGLPALRARIAAWYSGAGLPTTPDQVLVTSGGQQAIELVATGCLRPGDPVAVETPTYRGALQTLTDSGARLCPVPVDEQGMRVRTLQAAREPWPPRLIYVQSTVHNPTGAVLSEDRRRRLLEVADRYGSVVADDCALNGTQFSGAPRLPLAASAPDPDSDALLTIGSMSKLFWGGLRVGWIRGSARTISRLAQVKGLTDLGTSLVSQHLGTRLLDHVDEAVAARRAALPAGLGYLTDLLSEHLPDWTWQRPNGGASLWVRLPTADATGFAQIALRHGVAVPAGAFFTADRADDCTRLPYSLPRAVLRAGVHRLALAWSDHLGSGGRDLPGGAAVT